MTASKPGQKEPNEGRRERKRRQTRGRIEHAAMALFLDRGFDQTTIDVNATGKDGDEAEQPFTERAGCAT